MMQKLRNKEKQNNLSKILLAFLTIVLLCSPGCTKTSAVPDTTTDNASTIEYTTFELKPDDIRLKYLNHPLFSFEYPSIFKLIDLNNQPANVGRMPMSYNESEVLFLVQDTVPKSPLYIAVQKPGYWEYRNTSEKLELLVSNDQKYANSFITSHITISGIQAYYVEAFFDITKTLYEPEHKSSSRACYFDYAGLMWEIIMDWNYQGDEPPEVKEYFNHIIETFKILE